MQRHSSGDLGLDSSDEEDQQQSPGQHVSAQGRPDQQSGPESVFTYTVPRLPKPPVEAKLHMTRLPNILDFRVEEYTPEAFADTDAAQSFNDNVVMWRYKRDATGEVERDANQQPVRFAARTRRRKPSPSGWKQ